MKRLIILAMLLFAVGCSDSGETATGSNHSGIETTTICITRNTYEVIELYDQYGEFYKMLVISDTIDLIDTTVYTVPTGSATFVCHNVSSSDETYNIVTLDIVTDSVYNFNF